MAIEQTNWAQFLQPGSELAPDITFHIIEEHPSGEEEKFATIIFMEGPKQHWDRYIDQDRM